LAGETKLDPDLLFLERGLAAYDEVKRRALSAMAFACRAVLPELGTASSEAKSRAAQAMFEIIAASESEVTRSEFLGEVAGHLRLAPAALQRDFQNFSSRQSRQAAARPETAGKTQTTSSQSPSTQTPEHH